MCNVWTVPQRPHEQFIIEEMAHFVVARERSTPPRPCRDARNQVPNVLLLLAYGNTACSDSPVPVARPGVWRMRDKGRAQEY